MELAGRDITVNCVAPGWVDTEMCAEVFADGGKALIVAGISVGRVALPADVAWAAVGLHGPATLVLFEQAETDLFHLEMELREKHPDRRLVPVIGDIVEAGAVEQRILREYASAQVYHAAAHKHVSMIECDQHEAVRNNLVGTWRVAEAAGRHGLSKFVLVGTDKAVRPVSVMRVTKRLAELIVMELQERFPDTEYSAVRFGNVLGNSGSVIPTFKRQIERGLPLTVMHPETTRCYMTIQEAVQLILQASLLPDVRRSIAMLEMGEPVLITDFAKNLLELSGVRQVNAAHIVYTGLRPGERLHEELDAPDEKTRPTVNAKVWMVRNHNGSSKPVTAALAGRERALKDGGTASCWKRW